MHEGRHMLPEPVLGTTLADSSSADSFCKDGRKISVGDCALFRAGNSPPFIGIIRWLSTSKENNYLKLGVNWLYRPADVKISKGILPKAAPNEVFYSFHKDEISAASLLHPCKVAFLHKSVELPSGISSFVCRRVYDIANKCLWWLTDHDYINERQKEVDQLLDKTRLEMHAAVQSGGRSPKPLNSPTSTAPLKSGSDNVENSSSSFSSQGSKNKNKERGNQGSDPIKQERSSKLDDGDSVHFRQESSMIKAELANITDKGGLINIEGVEKLVHFMQRDRAEKKIDLLGRVMLANLIAATERLDCLGHFVQLRGVSVLDDWLQEAHKGKIGEGSSPKDSDKSVEELVVALLRALDKLPVNLLALQTCNVGKSVNNLRSHKNLEIHRKARSLVDTWKKRVDAEMKMNDAKIGMIQTVPWPGKAGFPEASHGGNRRPGPSAEAAGKCSSMQPSASKTTSVKFSHGDTVLKQTSSPVPVKLTPSLPSSVTINSKGSDVQLATTKEEKSSSSSQSHNSQSCSSEHPKTVGSTWKEDPRSSTAGSISTNKRSSTGTSRSRRSSNGFIGSGFSVVKKEISNGKSGITNRNAQPDKVSQSEVTCERMLDMPVPDHANSHRLIVRLPNPGRSPARGATGGSFEDPSVTGRRASSPGIFEKQDPSDKKTKGKLESHQAGNNADMNTESWPRSDVKDEVAGSDEGERSPAPPDEERGKITEELVKPMELSKSACSWRGGKKELLVAEHKTSKSHGSSFSPMNALIESCVKFSEAASESSSFRDDLGMNLLASVATGEMCNSETFFPIGSPRRNSPAVIGDKNNAMAGVSNANEIADNVPEKQDNDASPLHVKDESQQTSLRPVANNGNNNNNATGNSKNNLFSVQNKLAVAQNEQILASRIDLKSNVKPDEPSDNGCEAISTCMEVDDTLTDVTKQGSEGEEAHLHEKKKASTSGDNSEEVIDSKTEGRTASLHGNKTVDNAPEKTVETTQYGVASDSVGGLMGEGSDVERAASCTEVEMKVLEESKPCPSILTGINIKLRDEVLIHHQPLPTVAANCLEALDRNEDFFALPVSGIIKEPSKPENNEGMEVTSNSKPIDKENPEKSTLGSKALDDRVGEGDMFEENSSERKEVFKREQSPSELVQGHEPGVVSTGFMLSAVNAADEMEDRVAAAAASSTAVGSDTSGKLDFDLNEGFASAEGNNQGDTATSSAPGSSSVSQLPNMLPFSISPMSTTVPPTSITVAAAAKGPFVPPENLLRSRGELGWKGSAATSAFRPAEPRKVLELLLNATDVSITDNMSSKQGRPPLEIDLNMPDERDPEDTASMSSVPEVGSELVPASNHASLQSTGGLNLDLNRLDEGTENGQFSASTSQRLELSHLPLKLSSPSSRFLNGQVNVLRDFDLNDGPVLEEAGAVEPAPPNQYRSKSNLQSVPPMPGLRVNNIELGSLSSWFPPGSCSYPAVSVPSFLTDRGGDPPYPIVGSSGAHQRLLGSAINGTFGGDLYRGPILSSTMPFNPTTAASFPYAGIPLGTSFPLVSTSFSAGPTYMDTSSGGAGGPCFPAVPSQLVGPAVAVSSHYPRPYVIGLPEGSTSSGIAESNRKWGRHVLDLNAGPGSADVEGRDERFPSRQFSVASSQTSAEEQQARMYHAVKRKEPDGGWDAERFGYKQPSWH